jgi:outer membrane lipoprotein-sorting protein
MRRFFLASTAFVFLGASAFAVTAPPLPSTGQVMAQRFSPVQLGQLKRISAYLNTLKNVQGRFLQIAASGTTDQGTFYIRKPGRVRFEYAKPNPNLIVADGTTVAVANSQLKTTDRYPLVDSPLRLLLSENVDLTRDARIVSLKPEQGLLSVTARENTAAVQGSITLTFADTGTTLELRQWEVLDAQGARTAIVVNDMRQVADIPARLFVIEDLSPFK